jgi:RimJ/RimL family protein N-acetyltransferase
VSRDRFAISTTRLVLRSWDEPDRAGLARMNADPEVMADLGGPLTRAESDAKFDRFVSVFQQHGFTRWVIEEPSLGFVGYAGIVIVNSDHPLGQHHEIGWRLGRAAWGHGFASEAAAAAIEDAFTRIGIKRVLAYTAADNIRSIAVMGRLGLHRTPHLDFTKSYDGFGTRLVDRRSPG